MPYDGRCQKEKARNQTNELLYHIEEGVAVKRKYISYKSKLNLFKFAESILFHVCIFKTKNISRKYLANCHNKLSEEGTKSVSEKTISRWLNKLVELGLIAPPGRVNYIRLVVPDIDKI